METKCLQYKPDDALRIIRAAGDQVTQARLSPLLELLRGPDNAVECAADTLAGIYVDGEDALVALCCLLVAYVNGDAPAAL